MTALSVAREREVDTFDQWLVTPLRPVEILIGKSIPGLLIGLPQDSLIVAIAVHGFRHPAARLGQHAVPGDGVVPTVGGGGRADDLVAGGDPATRLARGAFLFMVPAIILSGFATLSPTCRKQCSG